MPARDSVYAISATVLFDGERLLEDRAVIVRGENIEAIVPRKDIPAEVTVTELSDGILAPGFVDLQVNGGGDVMLNAQPTAAGVRAIADAHRSKGTTGLLPTVISDTREVIEAAAGAVRDARAEQLHSVLGMHIEGPFLNPAKRGAHREDRIDTATAEDIRWLSALTDFPTLLTLAPERFDDATLQQLAASSLLLAAGHTDASFEEMQHAARLGVTGVTHLYNAMSPLLSRAPGAVGGALLLDSLWAGIIADGHHVHAGAIALAARAKPAGKLILVSDAMATVGGNRNACDIYGEAVQEVDGKLVNAEGKLAGSAIGMIDAVAYCCDKVGLPLTQCLQMASRHPATIMGLDDKLGRIAPRYRADLVHFDTNFTVRTTWVAGAAQTHGK